MAYDPTLGYFPTYTGPGPGPGTLPGTLPPLPAGSGSPTTPPAPTPGNSGNSGNAALQRWMRQVNPVYQALMQRATRTPGNQGDAGAMRNQNWSDPKFAGGLSMAMPTGPWSMNSSFGTGLGIASGLLGGTPATSFTSIMQALGQVGVNDLEDAWRAPPGSPAHTAYIDAVKQAAALSAPVTTSDIALAFAQQVVPFGRNLGITTSFQDREAARQRSAEAGRMADMRQGLAPRGYGIDSLGLQAGTARRVNDQFNTSRERMGASRDSSLGGRSAGDYDRAMNARGV